MKWRLPWKTRGQLRDVIKGLTDELTDRERRISDLRATQARDTQTISFLEGQVRRLSQGQPEGRLSTTGRPDFVLVGIPRGVRGIRVWASRKLSGAGFDMTPMDDPPPRFVIKATMAEALTVDAPDYAEAMATVGRIWANHDADARIADARAHASDHPQVTTGQRSLPGRSGSHAPRTPWPDKERWRSNLPAGDDDRGGDDDGAAGST